MMLQRLFKLVGMILIIGLLQKLGIILLLLLRLLKLLYRINGNKLLYLEMKTMLQG